MKKFANDRGATSGFGRDKEAHERDYEGIGKCPDWLDRFAKDQQTIVQQTRERNSHSLHDQINSVVNNSPLKTVDSVVKEMHERTGLSQYLNNISAGDSVNRRTLETIAADLNKRAQEYEELPDLFKDIPEAKSFIDNMAKGSHGTLAVEAVVESLKDCYSKNSDFDLVKAEDNAVREYINAQLAHHRKDEKDYNDANIGTPEISTDDENNPDNTDMFANIGNV